MIVDDPTYEDAARILEMMTVRYCKAMWMTNRAEWQRLRGTPGEPVPKYDVGLCTVIVFMGAAEVGEDELWLLKPEHMERMQRGETVYFHAKGMDTRASHVRPGVQIVNKASPMQVETASRVVYLNKGDMVNFVP